MMSFLVCLWPGKRGKERRWFRWGERLRVSVSCCGEEKKRLVAGKPGKKSLFCANFELTPLHRLSMKIAPIYRAGKRVILSSMGKTSQPLIRLEESKPLVQSVHLELPNLAAQGCELPEVAT
jgi:hypothetical protein